jgi:hypothetical protein
MTNISETTSKPDQIDYNAAREADQTGRIHTPPARGILREPPKKCLENRVQWP